MTELLPLGSSDDKNVTDYPEGEASRWAGRPLLRPLAAEPGDVPLRGATDRRGAVLDHDLPHQPP